MPADEKPSASGRDHTPDDRPEDGSTPRSGTENTGDDAAGGDNTTAPETGADGTGRAHESDETEGAEEAGKAEETPKTGVTSDTGGAQETQQAQETPEADEPAGTGEAGDTRKSTGTEGATDAEGASETEEATGDEKAVEAEEATAEPVAGSAAGDEEDTGAKAPSEAAGAGASTGATGTTESGETAGTGVPSDTSDAQHAGEPAESDEVTGTSASAGAAATDKSEEPDESDEAGGAAGTGASIGATGTTEPGETAGTAGAAPTAAAPVRTERRRTGRILVWVAASLVLVLAAGVGTAYGYYRSLRSDMVQYDIDGLLKEEDRPERINDSVNILFMGTDGYEEGSTAYSTEFEGERSDSIMLAHISPESRVSVISFPRDSLVALPDCDPYGETEGTPGYFGMINAAMYHGGPPCVVSTIESLSDVRIDHFVHLSFMSFRDVVDAIGGVDMCIPEPMEDSRSKLDLDAGRQTLDGDEALSFVRARYEIGDGGDIGRIDRQQMFLAALADQVTSNDVITDPGRLNAVLRAVAEHSATDSALTFDRMLSIAVTLADVELTDIEFHTVPWYQAPSNPNRVLWYEDQAEELFTAVREDRPLPLTMADEAPAPQDPPGASPSPADEEVAEASPDDEPARPGVGRDATSNPCSDGLGYGTGDEME
ncbi:LCP family protein [Nocardiopsis dassonvillei]|uniref:LCP family protein n=1 Tax=Nocardiopsis dassonvillei TaxID=2014 RepID=UPI000B9D5E9E|nr:LCP family protein [Nocardiopsis dassonvillei]ASU61029.1 transcriptional regulator [Nocardiopsis dassonvillei]